MIQGEIISTCEKFACVNVYAPQKTAEKRRLWSQISGRISLISSMPVLLMGDFKAVSSTLQKENCEVNQTDMRDFVDFISVNHLSEVPMINCTFMWYGPSNRRSRLDKALINDAWDEKGSWKSKGLNRKLSDHRPIVLYSQEIN